jgi:hypothetical protein
MGIRIDQAIEVRERLQDGELIPISAEDKQAALRLAAAMDEVIAGQPILRALLALEILTKHTVEFMAGKEWSKALEEIFRQIPIE